MIVNGFELMGEQSSPELDCHAKYYMHCRSGAKVISVEAEDRNKVFGIVFRTPVADSTGLPHILEHSVLCGSRKYPVKKPFLELLRGSLYTFLNAFTGLDRTTYPVASLNLKSFYNLADVYWDSVFHPLLTRETFDQEGWRFELGAEGELAFAGVVFNEMKGAQSSPLSKLMRQSRASLFANHPYAHDSGGLPEEIPNLRFEDLKQYHASHYHPSNAIIFFYGDDDPQLRLEFVAQRLGEVEYQKPSFSRIPPLPLNQFHQRIDIPFTPLEGIEGKGHITCNWLLPAIDQMDERLRLGLLSNCLVGSPSAPLYRTLIDSGLGSEVISSGGFSSDLCQFTFTVGLENVGPADFLAVESIIEETLAEICQRGFDQDLVEAVLNTAEFTFREYSNQSFPKGLFMLLGATQNLLYSKRLGGGKEGALAAFMQAKRRALTDSTYLTGPIFEYLPAKGHRTTVTMIPDTQAEERARQQETSRLRSHLSAMDSRERENLAVRNQWLQEYQMRPDTAEALATIPALARTDLQVDSPDYPCDLQDFDGFAYYKHDINTNGVVYVKFLFDLHVLPAEYLPYLELFEEALRQTGTDMEDFASFSRRISRLTGGIGVSDLVMHRYDVLAASAHLKVAGKCLVSQIPDLVTLLGDVLTCSRLDNKTRMEQLVRQSHASMEAGLIPGGHSLVGTRLGSQSSEADWLDEISGGVTHLLFLRDLAENFEERWPKMLDVLEDMRRRLIQSENLLIDIICSGTEQALFEQFLPSLLTRINVGQPQIQAWSMEAIPAGEAFILPAPVNYVGRSYNLGASGYEFHGSVSVATRLINTSWLWSSVREQGGAYGCSSHYNRFTGLFSFVSYRDPRVGETLEIYDQTAEFLRNSNLDEGELDKLVIGTFGDLDQDLQPRAQGEVALQRELTGSNKELRLSFREEILETSRSAMVRLADFLDAGQEYVRTVVLGSEIGIQEAAATFGVGFDVQRRL